MRIENMQLLSMEYHEMTNKCLLKTMKGIQT